MRSPLLASFCFMALIATVAAGCDGGGRRAAPTPDAAVDLRANTAVDAAVAGPCASCPARCCQNKCLDLTTDPRNCGACGTICKAGTQCKGGMCICVDENGMGNKACGADETCCAGQCVNTTSDAAHCGACDKDCTAGGISQETCVMGKCGCSQPGVSCDSGNGEACCSGTCLDVSSDRTNCGMCGKLCAGLEKCAAGNCVAPPPLCGGKMCKANENCLNKHVRPRGHG